MSVYIVLLKTVAMVEIKIAVATHGHSTSASKTLDAA
jgi:hypothetical protein